MRAIAVGTPITPYALTPTTVRLFRFSAVTWNAHRIHFDGAYAAAEGYPGVLVQSHLHGCLLLNAVLEWAGPGATPLRFAWRNRGIAIAGDLLTVTGRVTAVEPPDRTSGSIVVTVELEERNQHGDLCAPGRAVLALAG